MSLYRHFYSSKTCSENTSQQIDFLFQLGKYIALNKLPVHTHLGAKEQLSKENEELKQSKEELEVRMNALKSQYEGRLMRLDRELREMRESQAYSETREEPQEQSGAKVRNGHKGLRSEVTEHRNIYCQGHRCIYKEMNC